MNQRVDGWYWIKWGSSFWEPAEWNFATGEWWPASSNCPVFERDLDEINETRIKAPNE